MDIFELIFYIYTIALVGNFHSQKSKILGLNFHINYI